MSDQRDRFEITWRGGAYRVSIPNYQGGEVYTAEYVDGLRAQLAAQIIIQRGWEDEARKATSQLASARKALEEIETFCSADSSTLGAIARLTHIRGTARQQLLSLTDEQGEQR